MTTAIPLMPKATAVWLVENTALSFEQIADFCKLHPLEVQAIADGEAAQSIKGLDPILTGQLSREAIETRRGRPGRHSSAWPTQKVRAPVAKRKGPRYTPVSRRQDRPNAILWLLRNHPELKDAAIMRLVGTTKPTIESIRSRTHWNANNLQPMDPVTLGLCSQIDLDFEVEKAAKNAAAAARPSRKAPPCCRPSETDRAGCRRSPSSAAPAARRARRRARGRCGLRQAQVDDRAGIARRRGRSSRSRRARDAGEIVLQRAARLALDSAPRSPPAARRGRRGRCGNPRAARTRRRASTPAPRNAAPAADRAPAGAAFGVAIGEAHLQPPVDGLAEGVEIVALGVLQAGSRREDRHALGGAHALLRHHRADLDQRLGRRRRQCPCPPTP